MTKTLVASLLALTLAITSLSAAHAFGIRGEGANGGGGSSPFGGFPNPNDDDEEDDDSFGGIWDIPERDEGIKIDINKNFEIKRPKLDKTIFIDFLGDPDGEPLTDEQIAKLNLGGIGLVCAVAGTPSEFPDDILISNVGLVDVPLGARIGWQTVEPNISGMTVLGKTLKPGKSIKLNGVLAGGLAPETECLIKAPGA